LPATAGASAAAEKEHSERSAFWRWLWILLAVVLFFGATYALSWFNAYRLTERFVADADASYAAGAYLDALVGFQTFDPATNDYVNVGGYLAVEKIWSGRYSWPQPPAVPHAQVRSQEIIDQRLTLAEAEQYIQANIGRTAPYFGEIYLRLGELYEAEGSLADAREIYESIPDLFANRPDLIQRSQEHLARLAGQSQ
jgi:tetratricopeptide (TPR) repeat protein